MQPKPKRADKVLLSAMPAPPVQAATPTTETTDRTGNGSSPYRTPRDASPQVAPERPPRWQPKENILQVAAATGRFETLGQAIAAAGLTATLSETGPFTLFAPTDKAFAKMPSADLRALLEDKARLLQLLSYHVVPSKVRAPRRQAPSSVTTLDGKALEIALVPEDGGYRIGEARIVKTNMRASNGVVHAVDTVLTPR
ncbi:MAG: fasciclin domain-containing protein [Gemmatimonadaceae bacterium]